MKELQIALKALSLFLEVFLGLFLFSHMFLPRRLSRRFFWISAYFILYFGLILTEEYWITTWVQDAYPVYLLMHSSLLMIYGFLFCKGKAIFKVFLSLTYVSLITMSQTPGLLLLDQSSASVPGWVSSFPSAAFHPRRLHPDRNHAFYGSLSAGYPEGLPFFLLLRHDRHSCAEYGVLDPFEGLLSCRPLCGFDRFFYAFD